MYDNIASLKFVKNTSGDLVVTTMVSAEKEEMELLDHVTTDSRVEEWMNVVLQAMRLANRKITKAALFYYCDNMTRLEWMMKYQVETVSLQIVMRKVTTATVAATVVETVAQFQFTVCVRKCRSESCHNCCCKCAAVFAAIVAATVV